ncbi:hypothetical protein BHE74_00017958 [Ensete ventricosum]|nr:hypothetical protein GW17_00018737 [Ensete ventricosum]RWW74118.1 hypothetical protein BHE74_00017958 [Ensete ventricosum]RZS11309.1 hypothetical protein BHM03_00042630 [Ensete ventricosum]
MSVIPLRLLAGLVTALHLAGAGAGFPAKLTLERAVPVRGAPLEHLRARDSARHGRLLLGSSSSPATAAAGVVDFPVDGSANPAIAGYPFCISSLFTEINDFCGLNNQLVFILLTMLLNRRLYFTRVKLGNPAKEFYVQIDTGSDILWVTCSSCTGCPTSSGLNVRPAVPQCSNSQSGDLTKSDRAIDGIFGFGQNDLSVISQLSSAGNFPKVFSHCLRGSDSGGGILVLGEIVEPGIVYTPLVKSQ